MGQFPGGHKTESGDIQFRDAAVDVFYQPNPAPGHGHYFSMFVNRDRIYIANADYVTELIMYGIVDDAGDILYARFQHDFRYTTDRKYGVDGGWWSKDSSTGMWGMNTRTIGSDDVSDRFPTMVSLRVIDGVLTII